MRSEKAICAPPCLSKVSPTFPLKRFQCSSDWRWPSLVLSRTMHVISSVRCVLSCVWMLLTLSPWYNRTGRLGVKHQFTYLLTYCSSSVRFGLTLGVSAIQILFYVTLHSKFVYISSKCKSLNHKSNAGSQIWTQQSTEKNATKSKRVNNMLISMFTISSYCSQVSWPITMNKDLPWTMGWTSLPVLWDIHPENKPAEKEWNNLVQCG